MMNDARNYAWPVTAISKEDYDTFVSCVRSHEQFQSKTIVVFGAGIRGAEIGVILGSVGYSNIIFTDNNPEKWGGFIDEYPIVSVSQALAMRQEAVYMISVEEGAAIQEQLLNEGLRETIDFFYPRNNLYDRFMHEFKRSIKDEILIMGDCMFEVVSFSNSRKDSLTEIMQDKLGYENVKLLTMHGMGLPAFYHVLKGQIDCGMTPRILVLMLNFETLTGKQHLLPRSQHTKLMRAIWECAPDDEELAYYASLTEERVQNIQAEFFTTNKYSAAANGTNNRGVISDRAARAFFRLNYMFTLDPHMESMQYLRKIMKLADDHRFSLLPFVPPVNYERGTELFGEAFEAAYSSNYKTLESIIESAGFQMLDFISVPERNSQIDRLRMKQPITLAGSKLPIRSALRLKELRVNNDMDSDVKTFVVNTLRELDPELEIDMETDLLGEDILDSLTILFLITELENNYSIQVPLEDLVEDNFKDLNSIERYILSLIKADNR